MSTAKITSALVVTMSILLCIGLYTGCQPTRSTPAATPSSEESQGEQTQPTPLSYPSHNFPTEDIVYDSQYWNTGWDAIDLYQTLRSINASYYDKHRYIEGVFDCNDMAIDIWNILHRQGITSVIVIGNLDVDQESFAECDHAWLLIIHKDTGYRIFVVEPTNGETYALDLKMKAGETAVDLKNKAFVQYIQGYFYSSPSDLRADMKGRW